MERFFCKLLFTFWIDAILGWHFMFFPCFFYNKIAFFNEIFNFKIFQKYLSISLKNWSLAIIICKKIKNVSINKREIAIWKSIKIQYGRHVYWFPWQPKLKMFNLKHFYSYLHINKLVCLKKNRKTTILTKTKISGIDSLILSHFAWFLKNQIS